MAEPTNTSLLGTLDRKWLKLPLPIMRDLGPACQTMAGMLNLTKHETFVAVAKIAGEAHLPLPSVRKHLVSLERGRWIRNIGRCETRSGIARRTCTIKVSAESVNAARDYAPLPLWALTYRDGRPLLPWSTRAVLSVFMRKLLKLKAAAIRARGGLDNDKLIVAIEKMGMEQQFRFPLKQLQDVTGLTRHSCIAGKRHLERIGVISREHDQRVEGGDASDILLPNWDFMVTEKENGLWSFHANSRGCKSG